MTSLTRRIPTTPEVHERLRDVKEAHEEVETYDDLLRLWLEDRAGCPSGTLFPTTREQETER